MAKKPQPDKQRKENGAILATSPEMAAIAAISATEGKRLLEEETDVLAMISVLRDQTMAVRDGDMSRAEAMLISQATALQSLFANLTGKAFGANYMPNFEAFMRMALRAQSQCRATLETLATIKNPPTVFARQANVTTGPQQINNGVPAPARPREIKNTPNELSGGGHELLPDARASGHAIRIDPEVETVEAIDRTKRRGRKGAVLA